MFDDLTYFNRGKFPDTMRSDAVCSKMCVTI